MCIGSLWHVGAVDAGRWWSDMRRDHRQLGSQNEGLCPNGKRANTRIVCGTSHHSWTFLRYASGSGANKVPPFRAAYGLTICTSPFARLSCSGTPVPSLAALSVAQTPKINHHFADSGQCPSTHHSGPARAILVITASA